MSEVQARSSASRGRGSGRGGRGGFASRGGRTGGRTNGPDAKVDGVENPSAFDDDQGVIADLKKQYGDKTPVIKEMFPEWSEVDILFALQETDGDETEAVTRIAEGTIAQWGEVSKTKKAPRAKKDASTPLSEPSAPIPRPARGGRNVSEGGRGRGRVTDRGGRGGRGRTSSGAVATNGARHAASKDAQALSVPTEESSAWDSKPATNDDWSEPKPVSAPSDDGPKPSTAAAASAAAAKTWASMLRQSTTPKVVAKPKEPAPVAKPEEPIEPLPPVVPAEAEAAPEPEPAPEPAAAAEPVAEPAVESQQEPATSEVPCVIEPEVALPPSKDQLTETNLEQVHDDSHPPATATVASTAADSWDPRAAASATATPISASQHQHQQASRPQAPAAASSGYAASALKATTERPTRTPSYQRRILDQEEAVRMPGNREVDRAAVQFGAFNLGSEEDIDGDREEPETRAQPPAESPIAHPRTSLPPAVPQAAVPDAFASQKPATAAAAVAEPPNATPSAAAPVQPAASQSQNASQTAQSQYSRYGQPGGQEPSAFPQKPLDPFSQQANASQNQLDAFQNQQSQPQAPQQPGGAFSSAPSEYSSYYTADQQNRAQYNYYGQPYGQQGGQGQQDGLAGQQRSYGGYNNSQADNLSQYPQSGSLHNQQSRYGAANDAHNSGHTTPNPTTQAAQQQQQGAVSQAGQPQSHIQQNYGYNHPYAGSPFYSNYMNYGHYNQGGYGAPYGKGGMYQPYGMSPQGPYDQHASSPAPGFGQSSVHRADSGLGSGLGSEYGRAGSAQSGNPASLGGGSGFGGIQDSFARGGSSFPSQSGQGFNAAAQASSGSAGNDDLKPFGDSKTGSGPSPALGGGAGAGARPGSATQNTPASQAGLPPPQSASQMGGYGGYPSHLQGHNVHGGSGYGMGGSGQHGNAGFGSYGGQGYGNSYYGSGAGQQQQQQQQRGWGGNYH